MLRRLACVLTMMVLASLAGAQAAPAAAATTTAVVATTATTVTVATTADKVLRVGSKRFTESYVLAEILTQTAARYTNTRHLPGLGNTAILYEALRQGSIDLYPEYTGTIELEILGRAQASGSLESIDRALAPLGLSASIPLGFDNTYALAVRADTADKLKLASIGDLARHPELRFGLSHEFLGRADGWDGLRARYALPQSPVGLDHGLAYEALAADRIDVIDVYSTDAKIGKYRLRVLSDDLGYFPRYDAVVLHRTDVPARFPRAWAALELLAGRIDEKQMIELNGEAELQRRPFAQIARDFLARSELGVSGTLARVAAPSDQAPSVTRQGLRGVWDALAADDFWRLAREHVVLVLVSVLCAALVGVPAGIAAAKFPRPGALLLGAVGIIQTIPSLAMLALLISVLGLIGTIPALVALFSYALLPIVRNSCVGIAAIPVGLGEAATALGIGPAARIALVELPIALPTILAGVRTAAVINVGTATIAAFIGAGGFGERIATGLALNDNRMLLAGALPAAGLAFLVEGLFVLIDRLTRRRFAR